MKKGKKIAIIIVSIILVAAIIGGCVTYALLPKPLNYDIDGVKEIGTDVQLVSKNDESAVLKLSEDRPYKIQTFTDIHLDGKNKTSNITLSNYIAGIEKEKPDLIVLGGDIITSGINEKRAHQFAQLMENLGIYWIYTIGNHEGDNNMSITREKLVEIMSSYDHCIMLKGPEDIWGVSNFYVKLLNADDSLNQVLFSLDTGDEASKDDLDAYGVTVEEGKYVYDGAKESQVEWYKSTIDALEKEHGKFNSTLFIHIPLPQYEEEAEKIENGKGKYVYGGKLEGICESGFDSGLFDAIVEKGSTKAVFCGHDHVNDFGVEKDGVLLGYMQNSGYGSYTAESKFGYEEKDWLQGYMILTMNQDGTFTRENFKYSQIGISCTK